MMHAAIFDAVDAIDHAYEMYGPVHVRAPAGASAVAAADWAAYQVLVSLYPAQQASFDSVLANDLAHVRPAGATPWE